MQMSKGTAQAALALAFLANQDAAERVRARRVAEFLQVPTDSALKILQSLCRGGLVASRLGRSGGYWLARPAQQITLLQVFEAMEGSLRARLPLEPGNGPMLETLTRLAEQWHRLELVLRRELESCTVADLARDEGGAPEPGDAPIGRVAPNLPASLRSSA
jgi:Rrf2 family protein